MCVTPAQRSVQDLTTIIACVALLNAESAPRRAGGQAEICERSGDMVTTLLEEQTEPSIDVYARVSWRVEMLQHEFVPLLGVMVIRPTAPLRSSDFEELARDVDGFIEKHGKLQGLLIEADGFPGWADFASMLSHLRFVRDHHRQIRRVAVVTDSKFLSILPQVVDHFVGAEVRHFHASDREDAIRWVSEVPVGSAR
jgi:hypothetical protein